jgi:ParB/RepB/Spo0J family partition protein
MKLAYLSIKTLLEHEEIDRGRVEEIIKTLHKQKFIPIVVTKIPNKNKYVILDGHHRFNAVKSEGTKSIPCIIVKYNTVNLGYWRKEYSYLKKEDIISSALSGKKFPKKTTRHKFLFNPQDYGVDML